MYNTPETEIASDAAVRRRPFLSPGLACALLDCTRYTLFSDIESGRLPLAFDIRVPGVKRVCPRIATASVLAARAGLTAASDANRFLESVFPDTVPMYKPPRLAWILLCDYDHIYHLLGGRALSDAGGATRYQVPRESIVQFLLRRRLK